MEAWELQTIRHIPAFPAINVDETSLRVDKKNHWIQVYAAGDIALKFLHRKRGKEAIEAINSIPRYRGNSVHDCRASYLSYGQCNPGLCGSHLANRQKRYRNMLTRGAGELPVIPPKSSGKRGKPAKSDAHNLLQRLQMHEASVLRFTKEAHVSFTHNRAERDLRMSKVKQKV